MRFAFQIQSNSRMQIIVCSLYRSRVMHENTKYIRFVRAVLHNRITHPQPCPLLCAVGAWWRPGHTNLWGETFEIRLWTENQDYLLSRSLTVCTPGGLLGEIWLVVWTREKKPRQTNSWVYLSPRCFRNVTNLQTVPPISCNRSNVVWMLGQRLRRWPNIQTT